MHSLMGDIALSIPNPSMAQAWRKPVIWPHRPGHSKRSCLPSIINLFHPKTSVIERLYWVACIIMNPAPTSSPNIYGSIVEDLASFCSQNPGRELTDYAVIMTGHNYGGPIVPGYLKQ